MNAIPGTGKTAHLEENVKAGVMRITEWEWGELENAMVGITNNI